MQLREIHIDGFGVFHDKHYCGLTSGTNVLYGPNEYGKSTLLAFVRRVLFGFPKSTAKVNLYPAIEGGAYGGRIVCEFADARNITISRGAGSRGGVVKVTSNSLPLGGEEALSTIMGRVTSNFYQNVYAFGLDELQELTTFEDEEVKSHIYGAGLGLGTTSLQDTKEIFRKRAEIFFKTGGSAQKIPALLARIRERDKEIGEIEKQLSDYDALFKNVEELKEGVKEQERRLNETHKTIFPTYVKFQVASNKLSKIEQLPNFGEHSLAQLEELELKVSKLDSELIIESAALNDLKLHQAKLTYEKNIIPLESSITSLQKRIGQYRDASIDIGKVKSDRNKLKIILQTKIDALGKGWTEDKLRNFTLTIAQEDYIQKVKEAFTRQTRNIDILKNKLDSHREVRLNQSAGKVDVPSPVRLAAYILTGVGLVGLVLGLILGQLMLSVFSAVFSSVGVFMIISSRNSTKLMGLDELENKYVDELSRGESEHQKELDEWTKFLVSIGFDQTLSPDGALEQKRAIKETQISILSLNDLDSRIEAMHKVITSVDEEVTQIFTLLGKPRMADSLVGIEILNEHLTNAKIIQNKQTEVETQIEIKKKKVSDIETEIIKAKNQVQSHVNFFGINDALEFKTKHELYMKRLELEKEAIDSKTVIQSGVGIDDAYERFMKSIALAEPQEITSRLIAIDQELAGLNTKRDEDIRTIVKLTASLDVLTSGGELLAKQSENEICKEQLHTNFIDWATSQVALLALKKAISKYENTRQPEVIRAATDVFSIVTDHAYSAIIKPADINDLKILDRFGKGKFVSELSRGSREQLYFAMRLGLIKVYESKSEPMPMVMDDILVNFDDERGPLAMKALVEFSKSRQVIVFTCHKSTLDFYKTIGATIIS
jgi:uncharacterized protein YhaN